MADPSDTDRWYDLQKSPEGEYARQHREERIEEVEHIRKALNRLTKGEVIKSDKYFPIRFLTDGVDAYIELFDNASVWYSSLAVELALIVRLGKDIDQWKLKKERVTFYDLIEYAPKNVLSLKMKKVAHDVRELRNCYIHYYNFMYDQEIRNRRVKELMNQIEREYGITATELFATIENLGMTGTNEYTEFIDRRSIPVVERQVNNETKEFITLRYNKYLKWLSSEKAPQSLRNVPLDRVFEYYGIERFDARWCLDSSFRVLKHLRFL